MIDIDIDQPLARVWQAFEPVLREWSGELTECRFSLPRIGDPLSHIEPWIARLPLGSARSPEDIDAPFQGFANETSLAQFLARQNVATIAVSGGTGMEYISLDWYGPQQTLRAELSICLQDAYPALTEESLLKRANKGTLDPPEHFSKWVECFRSLRDAGGFARVQLASEGEIWR